MSGYCFRGLLLLLLLFAVLGCSDVTGLLPQVSEDAQASVGLVPPGTAVRSGVPLVPTLELTGDYELNPPDTAEISVLDRQKNLLFSYEPITGDLTDPEAFESIDSSDLPILTGLYYFRVELYRQGQLLSTEESPFFIAPEQAQIVSVSTYPSALVAGGYGLLQAKIVPPTSQTLSDPFLRWTQDGQVLAQGLLSEGFDTVPVKAPGSPGVFRGNLEIYPFGPEPGELFTFPAPLSRSIEAVVANVPPSSRTDLGPEEDFFTVLHLNGNLDAQGWGAPLAFEPTDLLLPGLRGRTFGYEFLADRSLEVDRLLFPLDDNGYPLQNTTLFTLVLDFLPADQQVTLLSTGVPGWSIEYFIDSLGSVGVEVVGGSQSWRVLSRPGVISEPTQEPVAIDLGFSLYPSGDEDLGVLILVDGIVRAGGLLPEGLRSLRSGQSWGRVGGNFSGVLDEFGVYARRLSDATLLASGLFAQALERRFGDRVEYAYSFESGVPETAHEDLNYSSAVAYNPGSVLLPPGEQITFPAIALRSTELEFFLGVDSQSEWLFSSVEFDVSSESEIRTLLVDLDGRVQVRERDRVVQTGFIEVRDLSSLRLALRATETSLVLLVDGIPVQLGEIPIPDEITAYIQQNPLASGSVGVQNFGAVRSQAEIMELFTSRPN